MRSYTPYALVVALFASLGGFLFGYNMSVIAIALLALEEIFWLSPWEAGFLVSIALIGAVLGASMGGALADRAGRRAAFFIMCVSFLFGIAIASTAGSLQMILLGRFITGIGIGLASVVTPLYLAEIAPSKHRGAFVTIYQLVITIGIFSAYFSDLFVPREESWRWVLGIGAVPAFVLLVVIFFLPETPQWLYRKGGVREAKGILKRLNRNKVDHQIEDMEKLSSKEKKMGWKTLFAKGVKRMLLIGILLCVFQQITGINIVIFYAPKIFQEAGFDVIRGAVLATTGVGAVNVIASFFAIWLMDRLGRRPLLLISLAGMFLSLIVLSLSFFFDLAILDTISAVSLMAYVFCFAIGMGPVVWVYISEIFPTAIRGRAIGICVFANWFFNYFVSLTFLKLVEQIGSGWTFSFYTLITLGALAFVAAYIKETKGKSLEEIERALIK